MENILYLDDYINLYLKKEEKIICFKPYKNTLKNGMIKDTNKFIKSFNKLKKIYKLNDVLINEKIYLVINCNYSIDERVKIKEILEELNYKKVEIINEVNLLEMNKKKIFINYNDFFYNIYYVDELGKVKVRIYENNFINKTIIVNILNVLNKSIIIIFGKNYQELINIIKNTNYDYYFYEESDNLFIKLLLKNKSV